MAAGLSGISLVMANSVICHECYYHPQAIECMSKQNLHEYICMYIYIYSKKILFKWESKKLVSEMNKCVNRLCKLHLFISLFTK